MTEDTKMILEEMAKMEQRIMERMDHEFTAVRQEMNTMHKEMTDEFHAVRYELQNVHDLLSKRINTIEVVTAQNYSDIVNLRAKQA